MCVDQRGSGITDDSLQDSPHITHSHTDREKEEANGRGIEEFDERREREKNKRESFCHWAALRFQDDEEETQGA